MFEEKIIKKVPGKPYANPKEKQGYIDDLSSKTPVELLELLERQNKLLNNKSFVAKLPDKGERIRAFKRRVEEALSQQNQVEKACGLLSNLTLTSQSGVTDEIEWTGKYTGSTSSETENSSVNFEDEETDPLKILASQGNTGTFKKKKHRLLEENEDSTKNELESALSVVNAEATEEEKKNSGRENVMRNVLQKDDILEDRTHSSGDMYAKILCSKIDQAPKSKKEPFRPFCTTKSGVHPGLHIPKHLGPHWEVTSATPPPPVHGATKLLSLQESLQVQQAQAEKLKEVQAKHAAERLAHGSAIKLGSTIPDHLGRSEFRDTQYDSDGSSNDAALENSDGEEDDEKQGTIVYTYTE